MHSAFRKRIVIRVALSLAVPIGLVGGTLSFANDGHAHAPATAPTTQGSHAATAHGHADDHEALEHAMEVMGESYEQLEKQIDDAAMDASSLELLGEFQKATLVAKDVYPTSVTGQPDSQRAAVMKVYRAKMSRVLGTACEVEIALLAGDRAKAKKALASLHEQEHDGHDQFRPKTDGH